MAAKNHTHPSLRHPRTGKPLVAVGFTASGRPVWPMLGADETDPLTRINDLGGRINELTDEELTELRSLLSNEIAALEGAEVTDETLEQITRVADMAEAAAAENTSREDAAAERSTRRDEALARARGAIPAAEAGNAEGDGAEEGGSEGEQSAEQVDVTEQSEQREPVAASARPRPVPLSQVRQTRRPEREAPSENADGRIVAPLVASGGGRISNDDAGVEDLTDRLNDAVSSLRNQRSTALARVIVASAVPELPHRLEGGQTPERNRKQMDDAVKAQTTITASGGICRPVTVDYSVPTWTNVEEPVKAALPSIGAPRGGLQYGQPVAYDATVYGPGVAVWTEANDENPGGSNTGPGGTGTGPTVKPCITLDCSSFVEVDVEAITQCAELSNFRGRFSPENVEVLMGYLQQAFVSKAEAERLRQMRAASKHVTVAQAFGAARDLFGFFDRLRAYFRSIYRLSDNVALEVHLESYVRELVRTDLRKAAFATTSGSIDNLMVTDAQIDGYFASIGLTPTWVLDDDTADQTFAKATAGTQSSPSTFPSFPARSSHSGTVNVRAICFPSGTFQRLDGGELNLGVVRDSALNAVNKYQVFSEIFEAVAMRGFESIDFVGDFIPNGATAGTITPA